MTSWGLGCFHRGSPLSPARTGAHLVRSCERGCDGEHTAPVVAYVEHLKYFFCKKFVLLVEIDVQCAARGVGWRSRVTFHVKRPFESRFCLH
jgi:hypothetical protein